MKTSTLKPKFTEEYVSAPAIRAPRLPRNFEQIRQRAHEIYRARGGMTGMTLNDWLKAEQQLKRELGIPTDHTDNQERNYEKYEF